MKASNPFVIVTHVVNNAIIKGFIPAAQSLGFEVVLLTDHGKSHAAVLNEQINIVECDVFNPIAILDTITAKGISPAAIFSNSDHLQTSTAIAANALDLPGKNWQTCYAAKEKLRMRQRLESLDLPTTWARQLLPEDTVETNWPFPLVAKPSQGVASMDVSMVNDAESLMDLVKHVQRHTSLLLEAYIEGALFTLETLGDGTNLIAVGGFDVELAEPPFFIEKQAKWQGEHAKQWETQALEQIRQFGVGFGVCHSEFIATDNGLVLVEINYRSIGDGREFLLDKLLPQGWFVPILRLHLGQPLSNVEKSSANALVHYLIAERSGVLIEEPTIPVSDSIEYQPIKQPGDTITLTNSNKDYLGVLYLHASNDESLRSLSEITLSTVKWKIA
ncbi:MAG TPA: ATP-grasp domain-containing protein [Methylophaga aminisulfidivorans]|uniref:ATP-grasp domain-containing protein n=1 Tax=Methylophaga TaxID=40222 RepID=UPI001765BB70|nr:MULTISPECIES: ATP-grasp domain-containing protein [Methylophaga]HIC47179.1 ATP-grasp domain-containing protein [Methylophaga sp.]HIM40168.1 ATP-grasp domain-containing protein [Methylophaga aminisulfidivorans]